ncbi:MAG TPA: hypothetical protein VGM75_05570 [Pseudonocardiaceae bacterium]|jgi:hypothetical protein
MAIAVILGCVVVAALVTVRAWRRRLIDRRVDALYTAAVSGRGEELRQWVDQGNSINLRDRHGDTALHRAYDHGEQQAIDTLVAYGAKDNLRNKEGLSPVDIGIMATAEARLTEGVGYLAGDGTWRDPDRGRVVYFDLKRVPARIYNPAVVRCVLRNQDRRKLLHLAIKVGMPDSEERLVQVLNGYGTRDMAMDYLNSGSSVLREGAERWARRHNYHVYYTGGRSAVAWGRF